MSDIELTNEWQQVCTDFVQSDGDHFRYLIRQREDGVVEISDDGFIYNTMGEGIARALSWFDMSTERPSFRNWFKEKEYIIPCIVERRKAMEAEMVVLMIRAELMADLKRQGMLK
jgi:hypothetical protein